MIFGLFAKDPHKEVRRLAADVRSIIDMAEQTYRPQVLDEIANITRKDIKRVAERCGDDATCRARELDRFKSLHREARKQNQQGELTAYTLLIINIRAEDCGELGDPVRASIDQFLQRWPAAPEPQDTLAG